MTNNTVTPTEALLKVARTRPFAPAVHHGSSTWSYAALWARVRELAKHIEKLDQSQGPIGLHMGLEIDYVAAAHAIWLTGRTAVVLSPKWSQDVMDAILERTQVKLVLYGNIKPCSMSAQTVCTTELISVKPPAVCPPPASYEAVQKVPVICSITPTSGSTGVPKSIVYPMRRALATLDEESSTLLKPRDGQWLRGGATFLRPIFEIRRFMFNQTTLYLDDSSSVTDQCASLCAELENKANTQLLRTHFTPSVFRAFVDYVRMKYGPGHSFDRLYWMVIGGESLSVEDLTLAKQVFPNATLACNYACSEVGFAGVSQMFVRPQEPVPECVNFDATQGCQDLVILDDNMNIVPKTAGASGIIGIITNNSATRYMGNPEASKHMFRPWGGDDILLYTDDIGKVTADGRIVVNGRRSRNVKVNGLFIDMDELERAMNNAFGGSVVAYKLVQSGQRIVLFWAGESTEIKVFKTARDALKKKLGDNIAMAVSSTHYIQEMPYNASYKIDIAQLQKIADSEVAAPVVEVVEAPTPAPVETSVSRVDEVAAEIAKEAARLAKVASAPTDVPLMLAGLNSITVVQLYFWLQDKFDYEDDMSRLFEEDVSAVVVARDIVGEELVAAVQEMEIPTRSSVNRRVEAAMDIAHEVARLARTTSPVPTDVPLMLAGLNSITVTQLHFWLQASFDYDEDMSKLFEEDCTAESLAAIIVGDDTVTPSEADSDATRVEEASEVDAEVATVAEAIAKKVGKLAKAIEAVPTDIPLMLAGLNSITVIQLHFWLQSEYDYEEDMSRLFEEDVTAEAVARDIRGVPVKIEAAPAPTPVIVVPAEPEPVKETPAPVKARITRRPAPLNLQTSNFTTTTQVPAAMRTGGLKTGGFKATGLPTGMVNGFLALTMLSPNSPTSGSYHGNGTPALSITRASLDMLADTHTPFAPVSAWMSEPYTPKVLCM
jgi:acyl-coenzyme A synthetase/AMP-(fatty) acid ligase